MEKIINPKANILIVDDDVLIAESNKFQIKNFGYNPVGVAINGQKAIDLAKEKSPDLILMDINLGRASIDGITAAEEIHKFADIPIIFLTAYSDPDTIERAKKVGPYGYLIKPFDKRELQVAIETSLYKHTFEKNIKEQELLFRTIANFAYEWEFWILPDLQFKYCSPSCQRVTGYLAEEFMANPNLLSDIVHPGDRIAFDKHLQEYYSERKDETVKNFQFRILSKQGAIKFISHTCSSIYDDKRNYLGRRVTNIDITERILYEQTLQAQKNEFETIFDLVPAQIWYKDTNNRFIKVNKQVCKDIGLTNSEIEGRSAEELFPSFAKQYFQDDLEVFNSQKPKLGISEQINTVSGEVRWLHTDKIPVLGIDGKTIGLIAFVQDITESNRMTEMLQKSEKNYRVIFNSTNEAIFIHDSLTGKILDVNDSMLKMYNYESKEDLMRNLETFRSNEYPYTQDVASDYLHKTTISGPQTFEWLAKKKNGERFWTEVSLKETEIDGQGRILAVVRDISERKKTDEALQKNKERWETLFSNSPNAIAIYKAVDDGKDFIFTDFNLTAQKIDNLKRTDVIGKRLSILFPGAEELGFLEIFREVWLTGTTKHINSSFYKDDRIEGWRENIIYKLNTDEIVAIYNDVTDRMNAEIKILQSEKKFRSLFENAADPILLVDLDGTILDVNPATCNILGYSYNELLNMKTMNLNTDEYKPKIKERFDILIQRGQHYFETNHLTKYGSVLQFEVSSKIIELENRKIILSVYRDITVKKQAEIAIRKSEEKFRSIFENHSAIKILIDLKTGNIADANEAAAKFYGWSIEELKNMRIQEINTRPPDEVKLFMGKVKTDQQTHFEFSHILKDRSIREVEVFSSKIDIGGNIYIHSIIHDITNRKIAEKALIESEQKFRAVIENADAIIIRLDTDGKISLFEGRALSLLGYEPNQFTGFSAYEIYKDYPEIISHFRTALNGKRTQSVLKMKSFFFECLFTPLFDTENSFIGTIGLAVNITDRIKLSDSLLKLTTAVEQSQISIIITNADAIMEYVNPYCCKITGYSLEETLNQNPRIFQSGETPAEEYKSMWAKISSGKKWTGVFHNRRKNGDIYLESTIITPIINKDGQITNYIAVKEDITEKIEKEKELKQYREHLEELVETRTEELDQLNMDLNEQLQKQKELEMMLQQSLEKEKELNEIKSRFISTTSHEFRTPLTSVLSSAELIKRYGRKWEEEKFNEHLSRIIKNIENLTNLLDEVLTLSRIEGGRSIIQPEVLNLYDFCLEIIDQVQHSVKRRHNFVFNYLPDQKVYFLDPKLLKFIISNLLSNAFKYTPADGNIELKISIIEKQIIIEIEDNGLGIPDEEKPYLFQPFYRCSNSVNIQGTGLGLSIIKQSVELHNGEIRFQSKLGKGTKFTVKLNLEISNQQLNG